MSSLWSQITKMNIFELMIFSVSIGVGFLCGKLLAQEWGLVGWMVGLPVGFLVRLFFFVQFGRFLNRRHVEIPIKGSKEDKV